jgi:hypothetical protein
MYRRPKIIYPILGLYIDDGRDPGHWENENDLRNRCFSRQLKMISIMYG